MKRTALPLALATAGLVLATGCSGSSDDVGALPSSSGSAGAGTTSASPSTGATASPSPQGSMSLSSVGGKSTRLTLDSGFLDAIGKLGLTIGPVEGATSDDSGGSTAFVFPVSGGTAAVSASGDDRFSGNVQHQGGLQLSGLGQSVTIDQLVLDGSSDQLTGQIAGQRVPLLPLATGADQVSSTGKQISLEESALSLTPDSLQALADRFHLPALPSLTLGSLTSTITGS